MTPMLILIDLSVEFQRGDIKGLKDVYILVNILFLSRSELMSFDSIIAHLDNTEK